MSAPAAENLNVYTSLFQQISDKTRLKILLYLHEEELCVCNLMDLLQVSQPSVSQHLRKLRDAGIIQVRKQGQWKYYRMNMDFPQYSVLLKLINDMPSLKGEIERLKQDERRITCTM
ncbi:ArsR/SmtB family transcription factor [Salisediminibacterium beveridgei]|uniref:Transcriptional regulator, ArsR family n=1 Tax=Salisediminibacterium beveridgei TaxID=632773 RepID=A0A1D7QYU8_9BACI|nr:metalloregulator ArsR/SmtB family transcription factor [Salisediminibacterium beveridgei]AOM84172.1 transcriptional regulator, ArsR family [Salisediminibacterium beveridgei]